MNRELLKRNIVPEIRRVMGQFPDLEKALDDLEPMALRDLLRLLRDQNNKISSLETAKRRFGGFPPGMTL
jgi:hypothetical protein